MSDPLPSLPTSPSLSAELRVQYLSALVACDRPAATRAIEQGLAGGLDLPTLLLQVLAPAQWEIGELWHRGEITIAQEHWASEATRREIERVTLAFRPSRPLDKTVLVAAAPGDNHTLPARIVAALFDWQGWRVDHLGLAPPRRDFVDYVGHSGPDLVALSVTLRPGVEAQKLTLALSRAGIPVLLGGSGTRDLEPGQLTADAIVSDALEGLQAAARLVGLSSVRDPRDYLSVVGQRITRLRTALGLSQAELSQRSGLTRPYLSAVERGKQNITLEASLKIAGALEVSMADLLSESPT